jgi:uncharacterized protein (DUF983 family)
MSSDSEFVSMAPNRPPTKTRWTRIGAIVHQRCPRCRRGRIFRHRLAMYNLCPACGLKFEREPGYFIGALYISYAFAAFYIGIVSFIVSLVLPGLDFVWTVLTAAALMTPFVPAMIRYSKVLWMTIDRTLDPGPEGAVPPGHHWPPGHEWHG